MLRRGLDFLMLVSTFLDDEGPAPTALAVSRDGIDFHWLGEVFPVGTGWDRYQARLGCVLPVGSALVGFYDGSASAAEGTEERCELAVSLDLRRWERASVRGPGLVSPHATGSLRYVCGVEDGGEWLVLYECARPDGSHDLRLSRVGIPGCG